MSLRARAVEGHFRSEVCNRDGCLAARHCVCRGELVGLTTDWGMRARLIIERDFCRARSMLTLCIRLMQALRLVTLYHSWARSLTDLAAIYCSTIK